MLVEKFQNKYRIGTKRASWHDYNGGEYFITICTKDRVHYFGEIYVVSWGRGAPRHHEMNQIAEYIENNVAKWKSDNSNQ